MTRKTYLLLSAGASTLCAVNWLVNCILDTTLPYAANLRADAGMTLLWASIAAACWTRWSCMKRRGDALP